MATDPNDEIPSFRFTDKRVDESWKEEMRREKAAKPAPAPAAPAPLPAETAPAAEAPQGAEASEADADVGAEAPPAGEAPPAEGPKLSGTPAEQKEAKVFMTFLAGLAQQALMQLGQMPNPYTGQAELDINGARYTIELLIVVQKKTKGNLSAEETQMLAGTIQDLKMAYGEIVAELQRQQMAAAKGAMKPGPGGAIPGPGFGRR